MLRFPLSAPAAFAVAALVPLPASAQDPLPSGRVRPVTATVRDAGVLHVASGTWTRKATVAGLGADTIYDNTVSSGYYAPLSGDTVVDEGRVPSPTSPTSIVSRPGCATSYTVDGFQIRYCTDRPDPALQVQFFESHPSCATVIGVTPTAAFALPPLPGSATVGSFVCWTVTVDIAGSSFAMRADGDGTYAGTSSQNLFAWSIRSSLPWSEQSATGPFLAGDPNISFRWDGTRWDDVVDYTEAGTGMGSLEQIRFESGPTPPGCYFFQNPFASFHLELYADACAPTSSLLTPFCYGDGTGTACPCGNTALVPGTGCLSSLGIGGRLVGQGSASLASDTVVLLGDQMPPSAPALFFQGTLRQNAGAGTMFGDGKRCAGGTVIRLGISANSAAGTSSYPRAGDPSVSARGQVHVPATRTYQVWYRNAASFCTSATYNLTNGLEITWAP